MEFGSSLDQFLLDPCVLTKLSGDGESIDPDAKPVEAITTIGSFFPALEELPNEDVLKLCRSYLDFLNAMVSECKKRFG